MPQESAIAQRLPVALLLLRIGVFIVMVMWTLDKFVDPGHAAAVTAHFYKLKSLDQISFYVIGGVQLIIVLAFGIGAFRRISYGLVLLMHAVSTFSSFPMYLAPWHHLLFFAAWPMFAACVSLYLLREADTLLSWDAMRSRRR